MRLYPDCETSRTETMPANGPKVTQRMMNGEQLLTLEQKGNVAQDIHILNRALAPYNWQDCHKTFQRFS
ncbi:hypothetical protein NKH89_19400 [Mesorhizobium sp. M0923]